MNISFQGIKNTSFIIDQDDYCKFDKTRYLNTELTNDQFGRDLEEYRELIKNFPEFENPFSNKFVNIAHCKRYDTDSFQLNGKNIPENDKHIPIFSFLSKITKKISTLPDEQFTQDLSYLKSNLADYGLLMDKRLTEELNQPIADIIDAIHNPDNIRKCSKNISKGIIRSMLEYFKV